MGKGIYVGNLSFDTTDAALEQLFAQYGAVESAQVLMDRDTGRSKSLFQRGQATAFLGFRL